MAKRVEVEAVFKAKDQASPVIAKVESRFKRLTKVVKSSALAQVAALGGVVLALRSLVRGISAAVEKAGEQEAAVNALTASLADLGDQAPIVSAALQEQASALQKVSTFGDEVIIRAQTLIASFIKEEDQIKAATVATLDLAAAKGFDLVAAADLVSKTLGSSTNALTRYGIAVEGAVGSTERLTSLTGNINKVFGGRATADVNTFVGATAQLSAAFGDAQEKIGFFITKNETLLDAIKNLTKFFAESGTAIAKFAALVGTVAVALAQPFISLGRLVGDITALVQRGIQAISGDFDKGKGSMRAYAATAANLGITVEQLKIRLADASADLRGLSNDAGEGSVRLEAMQATAASLGVTVRELRSAMAEAGEGVRDISETLDEGAARALAFLDSASQLGISVEELGRRLSGASGGVNDLASSLGAGTSGLVQLETTAARLGVTVSELRDDLSATGTNVEALGATAAAGSQGFSQLESAASQLGITVDELRLRLDSTGSSIDTFESDAARLGLTVSDLRTLFNEAGSGVESFATSAGGSAAALSALETEAASLGITVGQLREQLLDAVGGVDVLASRAAVGAQGVDALEAAASNLGVTVGELRSVLLGAGSGVEAFGASVGGSAGLLSALSTEAERLGITVGDLREQLLSAVGGVDALSARSLLGAQGIEALNTAASNLGITVGELRSLLSGSGTGIESLGAAAGGSASELSALGVEAARLGITVGELRDQLVTAVGGVDALASRADLSAQSIEALEVVASNLGITVGELRQQLADAAESVDALTGSLGSSNDEFAAFTDTAARLGVTVEQLRDRMLETGSAFIDVATPVGEAGTSLDQVATSMDDAATATDNLAGKQGDLTDSAGDAADAMKVLATSLGSVTSVQLVGEIQAIEKALLAIKDAGALTAQEFARLQNEANEKIDSILRRILTLQSGAGDLRDVVAASGDAFRNLAGGTDAAATAMDSLGKSIGEVTSSSLKDEILAIADSLQKVQKEGSATAEEFDSLTTSATKQIEDLLKRIILLEGGFGDLGDSVINAREGLQALGLSFNDILAGGSSAADALDKLGRSLGQVTSAQLTSQIIQIADNLQRVREEGSATAAEFENLATKSSVQIQILQERIRSLEDGTGDLTDSAAAAAAGIGTFGEALAGVGGRADNATTAVERLASALGIATSVQLSAQIVRIQDDLQKTADKGEIVGAEFVNMQRLAEEKIGLIQQRIGNLRVGLGDLTDAAVAAGEGFETLGQEFSTTNINAQLAAQGLRQLKSETDALTASTNRLTASQLASNAAAISNFQSAGGGGRIQLPGGGSRVIRADGKGGAFTLEQARNLGAGN